MLKHEMLKQVQHDREGFRKIERGSAGQIKG
jgi:hypothetical protein